VAGLRLDSVFVVLDASLNGYTVPRGQTIYTALVFSPARTFDLLQNAETPSFRVQNYWIGDWGNYPQDAKLPQPQDTASLTSGALLVRAIHTWGLSTVWVQEGVYRPGFTLKPGLSAPALSTYMQQYFNAAYRCDPVTGGVPRTGTLNWNSVGKINTAAAQPTGVVDTNGYYFKPTEFGKAILTTLPQEDGSYGEVPVYTLGLLVDKNRDGTIDTNDVTSAQNPHVFWVNNDADRLNYDALNLWDELDLDPVANGTDAAFVQANRYLPSLRDLEDYDRLHIPGLRELCRDLPAGHTVTLRWANVTSGSPGLFLFEAAETDGGRNYLTDEAVASNQTATAEVIINGVSTLVSPFAAGRVDSANPLVLHDGTTTSTNEFFLYCGTSRGAGELAVEVRMGSQLIGSVSVFLDLRDAKELYERWTAGEPPDWHGSEPATSATLFGDGLPPGVQPTAFLNDDPTRPYILFVHGWNMNAFDKDAFAETAFKRLYWQNYQGRFGTLRWPTAYNLTAAILTLDILKHYNRSEYYAWKSGEGLRSLLVSLNQRYPGKVYLMAHSMGNVAAGEALALNAEMYAGGQIVRTYVASQAAVSMHAYNGANNDPVFQLTFQRVLFTGDNSWVNAYGLTIGPDLNLDSQTPNVHRNWLATNAVSCVKRVNFYNPNDFALSLNFWEQNQTIKPGPDYKYVKARTNMAPWLVKLGLASPSGPTSEYIIPSRARQGLATLGIRVLPGWFKKETDFLGVPISVRTLDWEYRLNDMYEAMAFCSESRVKALGATWDEQAIPNEFSLWSIWPPDTETSETYSQYGRHKWHSAQFRMNNMKQHLYWEALLDTRGFELSN